MSFDYLPRAMHRGQHGGDILALERALHKLDIRPRTLKADYRFGRLTVREIKKLQKHHGLRVDGIVGPHTSDVIVHHHGYDDYGRWLIHHWDKTHHQYDLGPRERVVRAALYAVRERYYVHYLQRRPMLDMGNRPNVPNYCDCSTLATWCYKDAGLPDPNGEHYNGIGNTGTLSIHGRRVSSPRPGDLVFSFWPISHVSIYIGGGKVVSHGHEGSYPQDDPAIYPMFSVNEIRSYI